MSKAINIDDRTTDCARLRAITASSFATPPIFAAGDLIADPTIRHGLTTIVSPRVSPSEQKGPPNVRSAKAGENALQNLVNFFVAIFG
jgi:hypothetical protein